MKVEEKKRKENKVTEKQIKFLSVKINIQRKSLAIVLRHLHIFKKFTKPE